MDGLDWVGAEIGVNNSTSWESDPRGESLMGSNSSNYAFLGGKVDIPESIFSPNQLHVTGSSTIDSNCSRVLSHMFQHSAPSLDPIQITSSWNFSQQEEAIKLSDDDDKVPGKSLGSDLSSSPMLNGTDFINQLNGLFSDYGMANKLLINNCLQEAKAGLIATATGSSGSLDCLLSASTSNTDNTSVEDDAEISKIFSDCQNLWNFRAVDAVSSGYSSACDSSNAKDQRHNHNNINELHETASQTTSSDQHANQAKPSGKRKSETLLKNVVNNYTSDSSTSFNMISETPPQPKKPRSEKHPSSSNINFQQPSSSLISRSGGEPDSEAIAQVKEMMYQAAAFRPVSFGTEMMEKPKRKNVRISTDPQTVAARQRRERISERIRVLQRMVPGGSKMDTASMLDEAANYLKFLRSQVKALEAYGQKGDELVNYHPSVPFNHSFPLTPNFPFHNPNFIYHPKF